jgi:hypothetical protein
MIVMDAGVSNQEVFQSEEGDDGRCLQQFGDVFNNPFDLFGSRSQQVLVKRKQPSHQTDAHLKK